MLRTRSIGLAVALAVAVGSLVTLASPAQAATPAILITFVQYNSPCNPDTNSTYCLNGEAIRIKNTRTYTLNLKNWTIRDKANHVFYFSTDYRLNAGQSVYLHTGKGTNKAGHLYWQLGWYVWNNDGDTAYVRNPSYVLIDSCSWGRGAGYTYC